MPPMLWGLLLGIFPKIKRRCGWRAESLCLCNCCDVDLTIRSSAPLVPLSTS